MTILDLIKEGENKKLEFKEQFPSADKIAKTIVAFSNMSGGKLIIGVDDSRNIVGVEESKIFKYEERISSIIYDWCYPNILPEIYTLNVEGKLLLVVEVFRGGLLPYYLKQKGKREGTYIRIGSTNRLADESMIIELQRQRLNRTFDEEENFEWDLNKFDLNIIYQEFEKIGKSCDFEKLKNLKLIKELNSSVVPTNALCVVLGRFDNVVIKCARFKGTSMEVFIDKKEFSGDLFSILEQSISFLQNHLHLHAKIEGMRRVEEYEIPFEALREIVLNAIIHRDYTRSSDIKIAIYDDIIEIISVGGFVNGLTIEDISNGRSELRNRVIANLFKELRYIESWGSGIQKVRKICKTREMKFELSERASFVNAVFYRPKNSPKVSNSIEKVSNSIELTPQEESIIELLNQKKRIISVDIEKLLGVKEAMARRVLNGLANKGVVRKIGKTRGSYYVLKEEK